MKSYYLTDVGKVRSHNEDSVLIIQNGSGETLMLVCDGMADTALAKWLLLWLLPILAKDFKNSVVWVQN